MEHSKADAYYIELMGKIPDQAIAEIAGITRHQARLQRVALGIPAYEPQEQRKWKQKEIDLLGAMSDNDVARKTGRTYMAVRTARTNRGIQSFDSQQKAKKIASIGVSTELAAHLVSLGWTPPQHKDAQ